KVLDLGVFKGNDCLVYPLGGISLDRLLGNCHLMPLPRTQVQAFSWQVAKAIEFLHSIGLIHTDIKPANIILVDGKTTFVKEVRSSGQEMLVNASVKVIDLDDVVGVGPIRRWISGTEPYRAPEVSVGDPWSKPIDAFSFGCFVAELFVGSRIFGSCQTPEERLASLERSIGLGPTGYGRIADDRPTFFTHTNPKRVVFDTAICGRKALDRVAAVAPLSTILRWPDLLCVCNALLRLDPESRITLSNALEYPFFESWAQNGDATGQNGLKWIGEVVNKC
ncbi:kinase-like domain-containing protein, partial [Mycena leptocephala]